MKAVILGIVLSILVVILAAVPAFGRPTASIGDNVSPSTGEIVVICGEGLTPGYWKNHTEDWMVYTPGQTLESVFDIPARFSELADDTLLEALSYGGGSGDLGMAKTLLRHAVAALLNAAHTGIDFNLTESFIIEHTNWALAFGTRSHMEQQKNDFEVQNELGGSL